MAEQKVHVVLSLNSSEHSKYAFEWALKNFLNVDTHKVTLLTVVEPPIQAGYYYAASAAMYSPAFIDEVYKQAQEDATKLVRDYQSQLESHFGSRPEHIEENLYWQHQRLLRAPLPLSRYDCQGSSQGLMDVRLPGLIPYAEGLKYQSVLMQKCRDEATDSVLMLQHLPVYTAGRRSAGFASQTPILNNAPVFDVLPSHYCLTVRLSCIPFLTYGASIPVSVGTSMPLNGFSSILVAWRVYQRHVESRLASGQLPIGTWLACAYRCHGSIEDSMKFSSAALLAVSLVASVQADELVDNLKKSGITVQARLKAPAADVRKASYSSPLDATVVSGKLTEEPGVQHYVGTLADNRIEWYFQIKGASPAATFGEVMGPNVKTLMEYLMVQMSLLQTPLKLEFPSNLHAQQIGASRCPPPPV
ncbi:UspA domain-containing protein [Paramicrosporidium saccamoebae]|uniref:UspA domain-containing protein n=1 Tax=Paramicrosporidium saccamoebae TaxID=1246581 RepID=A0A2H9TL67_9FUNG|nr:UspA domain-containing protein [Paramicrosporidium saccamoebae]